MTRAGRATSRSFEVAPGTAVRAVVHRAGEVPEGCAVLDGETPIPLDTPIERPLRLTVVPTFSGG